MRKVSTTSKVQVQSVSVHMGPGSPCTCPLSRGLPTAQSLCISAGPGQPGGEHTKRVSLPGSPIHYEPTETTSRCSW